VAIYSAASLIPFASGTTNINGSPETPRLTLEVMAVCGKRRRKSYVSQREDVVASHRRKLSPGHQPAIRKVLSIQIPNL
jgi:hypothetical protein